jgi:hypothetical protein
MTINRCPIVRLILAAALAVVATERSAFAQRGPEARELQMRFERARLQVRQDLIEQVTLGRLGNVDVIRDRLESALTARVEKLDRQYGLSTAQKKKLVLAGRGDIKHFVDRWEETRKKLALATTDGEDEQEVRAEIESLQRRSKHDVFGEESLLMKALKKTLTPEQSARYKQAVRDVIRDRHRATLQWVLGTLDQMLGLTPRQHQQLEPLLIEETRPPRRFGEEDYYGVMCQLGRVPEARLRPIFNEEQWAKLSRQVAEAKRKEEALKSGGYLPEDDVAAAPAATNKPGAKLERKQG